MKVNYSETFLKRSTFLLALSFCKIGQMRSETTKKNHPRGFCITMTLKKSNRGWYHLRGCSPKPALTSVLQQCLKASDTHSAWCCTAAPLQTAAAPTWGTGIPHGEPRRSDQVFASTWESQSFWCMSWGGIIKDLPCGFALPLVPAFGQGWRQTWSWEDPSAPAHVSGFMWGSSSSSPTPLRSCCVSG